MPTLDPEERVKLAKLIIGQFDTQEKLITLLSVADLAVFEHHLSFNQLNVYNVLNLIKNLEKFGPLEDRETHTAIGALLIGIIAFPKPIPSKDKFFCISLIVRHRMIEDLEYNDFMRMRIGEEEKLASMFILNKIDPEKLIKVYSVINPSEASYFSTKSNIANITAMISDVALKSIKPKQGSRIPLLLCFECLLDEQNLNAAGNLDLPDSNTYLLVRVREESEASNRIIGVAAWLFYEGNNRKEQIHPNERCMYKDFPKMFIKIINKAHKLRKINPSSIIEVILPYQYLSSPIDQTKLVMENDHNHKVGAFYRLFVRPWEHIYGNNKYINTIISWEYRLKELLCQQNIVVALCKESSRQYFDDEKHVYVLTFGPKSNKKNNSDIRRLVLDGVPLAIWTRTRSTDDSIGKDLQALIEKNHIHDLLLAVRKKRIENDHNESIWNHITLMWSHNHRMPPDVSEAYWESPSYTV